MKHTVERSYLIRRVERWEVAAADDVDPAHMIAEHFDQFSQDLDGGGNPLDGWTSHKQSEADEPIEFNEMHLEVVDREHADVIPIGRKRP